MRALQGDSELLTQTLLCFEEVSSRWFVGAKGVAHGPNTFRPTLSFSWPLVHLFSFFLDGAMEARLALLCFAAGWPGRSMPAGFCSRRHDGIVALQPSPLRSCASCGLAETGRNAMPTAHTCRHRAEPAVRPGRCGPFSFFLEEMNAVYLLEG